ncbi:hypothetical protein SKAU_G00166720 [Synaphobranchus kaupii]|uniref:Uncharacterized protein n=1 Tax=Synaphobranchus kaupii TaxID=118154 RepID=A0A9Q1FK33_SYNKA|nr:hypothetical protein SKAU_G00166720 [Synaphobranchus kaupii]
MDVIMTSALCCGQEDEPCVTSLTANCLVSPPSPTRVTRSAHADRSPNGQVPIPKHSPNGKVPNLKLSPHGQADRERREAEEVQEMGTNATDSLVQMLKQRQRSREQGFDAFLSDLEAKYSRNGGKASMRKRRKK